MMRWVNGEKKKLMPKRYIWEVRQELDELLEKLFHEHSPLYEVVVLLREGERLEREKLIYRLDQQEILLNDLREMLGTEKGELMADLIDVLDKASRSLLGTLT